MEKGYDFSLSGGQAIVQVEEFHVTQEADRLYTLESVDRQGNTVEVMVASRCG